MLGSILLKFIGGATMGAVIYFLLLVTKKIKNRFTKKCVRSLIFCSFTGFIIFLMFQLFPKYTHRHELETVKSTLPQIAFYIALGFIIYFIINLIRALILRSKVKQYNRGGMRD